MQFNNVEFGKASLQLFVHILNKPFSCHVIAFPALVATSTEDIGAFTSPLRLGSEDRDHPWLGLRDDATCVRAENHVALLAPLRLSEAGFMPCKLFTLPNLRVHSYQTR